MHSAPFLELQLMAMTASAPFLELLLLLANALFQQIASYKAGGVCPCRCACACVRPPAPKSASTRRSRKRQANLCLASTAAWDAVALQDGPRHQVSS